MIARLLNKIYFRSFQKELSLIRTNLSHEQRDGMLSMLWQNEAFRSYLHARENAIIITMANNKPSDDAHLRLQGRRAELIDLLVMTREAYNRTQGKLAKKRDTRTASQASA